MEKKEYSKPAVLLQRDIEPLTGGCDTGGANTLQDKLTGDPLCVNPMT